MEGLQIMSGPGGKTAGESGDLAKSSIKSVVGYLVFCELASGFTQGFYTPLIPSIAEKLDVTDASIVWFMTVQTLAAAVFVPLLSKLGDIFGHRRILRIAVATVFVGTIITAVAPSFNLVLLGRVLVGPLAVWLPLEIALIHSKVKGDAARTSIGLLVSVLTGGAILGTLAAGLVGAVSPNLTITLLLPTLLVAVSLYAVMFKVPASGSRADEPVDGWGFLGLAVGMVLLLSGLRAAAEGGFGDPKTIAMLVAAVVVMVIWVWWELRVPQPAVDVRLVASRRLGPVYLAGFLFGMIMFGTQAPLTTFLSANPADVGYGFAASSAITSTVIATITIMATVGAATFSKITQRIGIRALLVSGATAASLGSLFLVFFHDSLWQVYAYAGFTGLGMGFLLGGLPALVAELAPATGTGIATGVYNSLRTLGGATAGAVFAMVLAWFTPFGSDFANVGGYVTVFIFGAGAFGVSAVALLLADIPEGVAEQAAETADVSEIGDLAEFGETSETGGPVLP